MPLKPGSSNAIISENIREMIAAGHPKAQAVAAAYHNARDSAGMGAPPEVSAAFIVYHDGDNILWLKRTDGSWGFPGGTVEDGEKHIQAAIRESLEEVQHAPSNGLSLIHDAGHVKVYESSDGMFAPVLNEEHVGFLWSADPPGPLFPLPIDMAVNSAHDKREYDNNGWFERKDNPLSKIGVFQYLGKSIDREADPGHLYNVLRPAEELGSPETIESFKLLPWIDDHVMLGAEEEGLMPAERKGVQGVIGEQVYFDEPSGELRGNIKLMSQAMMTLIEQGKRELSCGYRCTYEKSEGITKDGQPYQYIQRNIRGNHLALVDSGRMGPDVAVLDHSETQKEASVAEPEKKDGESKGLTLEDAKKHLAEIVPLIAEMQKLLNGSGGETSVEEDKPEDGEMKSKDTDLEKPGSKSDPTESEEKKDKAGPSGAMDAAEIERRVEARIADKSDFYHAVSAHVGAFDHREMSIEKMASYAIEKLAIQSAPKAGQVAFVRGYLSAKPAATAMDAKPAAKKGSFIDRHLSGSKE